MKVAGRIPFEEIMRKVKTVDVWTVLYDAASAGPAADGTHLFRTRIKATAEEFARGRTCYVRPAAARLDAGVPDHIDAAGGGK